MGRAPSGAETDVCSTWAMFGGRALCEPEEQPEHSATVSAFRLDTFEVTVGRFRNFVATYPLNKPSEGDGAHPRIAGSGWQPAWNALLPATKVDLIDSLKSDPRCDPAYQTWTDAPGANENRPIVCLTWYVAFAFCAWDGGRLPTEAEWEYAAVGGDENLVMPWGNSAPSSSTATFGASSVPIVGATPLGASRWGQQDMAGGAWEFVLDSYAAYSSASVTDYARPWNVSEDALLRGGMYSLPAGAIRPVVRHRLARTIAETGNGVRCARNL